MADKVITLRTPDASVYGHNRGATAETARDEAWARQGNNDVAQGQIAGGMGYANGQAALGQSRGPTATSDPTAAANQASGANGHQGGAISLARQMAMGQQPSQAAYQLQAGLDLSSQGQQAMARGARGSAALATGQANAAANTSNLQQNAWSQGGLLRSKEMAAGRDMYGGMLNSQRQQDSQALGYANEFGQANAQRNDKYALDMAGAGVDFGGVANGQNANDLGNFNRGMEPVFAQDEANQQRQLWTANNRQQAVAANLEEED